jgi:hypothetical protein
MPTKPTTFCGICDAIKKETNHWFTVYSTGVGFEVVPWEGAEPHGYHYNRILATDACSDACVIKAAQQWLSRMKADAAAKAVSQSMPAQEIDKLAMGAGWVGSLATALASKETQNDSTTNPSHSPLTNSHTEE